LYRSLNTIAATGAQGEILKAHKAYGVHLADAERVAGEEVERVLREFDEEWLGVKED
jgi:hypothetical protein